MFVRAERREADWPFDVRCRRVSADRRCRRQSRENRVVVSRTGKALEITFTGTIDGDSITGTAKLDNLASRVRCPPNARRGRSTFRLDAMFLTEFHPPGVR